MCGHTACPRTLTKQSYLLSIAVKTLRKEKVLMNKTQALSSLTSTRKFL